MNLSLDNLLEIQLFLGNDKDIKNMEIVEPQVSQVRLIFDSYFYETTFFTGFHKSSFVNLILNNEKYYNNFINDSVNFTNLRHLTITNDFFVFTKIHNFEKMILPNCLETLIISHLGIQELPELPNSLKKLRFSGNNISKLPKLPKGLEVLDCSSNNLNSIGTLPESLIVLRCDNNKIISIENFPKCLHSIMCSHNLLTRLPDMSHLKYLITASFSSNKLIEVPEIDNLLNLGCLCLKRNNLPKLPKLPKNLGHLSCGYNRITTLDVSYLTQLKFLECDRNRIRYLNYSNTQVYSLSYKNNPIEILIN